MNRTITLLTGLLTLLLVLVGCQTDKGPVEPLVTEPNPALGKITLPAGSTINSAMLYVYQTGPQDPNTVTAHRITKADWDEATVTWNNFFASSAYDPTFVDSFMTDGVAPGWYSIEIKSLVQDWVDNPATDFGILLKGDSGPTIYYSSEATDYVPGRPYLEIKYVTSGNPVEQTQIIQDGANGNVADAYIFELHPDTPYGTSDRLYTSGVLNLTKYALLKFDLSLGGCTRTPGYWMTHSDRGPAPYDPTWKLLGSLEEDTPFFKSGKTYYQALWMSSRGGNAYYILAQAYIAAQLNGLSGAWLPGPVSSARDQAKVLFQTYTPAQVGAWKGSKGERALFLALAKILDDYNNGLTGPGHCPD